MRSIRHVLRLLILAVLLPAATGVLSRPLRAQMVTDHEQQEQGIQTLVGRFAEWYAIAEGWRDAVTDKANSMLNHTRELVRLRQKYEARAQGELGKLGERVPDWREGANFCGYKADGTSVCNVDQKLAQTFERALNDVFFEYRVRGFQAIDSVQAQLNEFIGAQFAKGAAWFEKSYENTPRAYSTGSARFLETQAKTGSALQDAAHSLNQLIDSIYGKEIKDQNISSGRAQQLTAHLTYLEALTELEVARAKLKSLDLAVTSTATQVYRYRQVKSMRYDPTRW